MARTVSFWLDDNEIGALDNEARSEQSTRNRVLRELIRDEFDLGPLNPPERS